MFKIPGVLTMKKISLALIMLIIVGICIPAVSAEVLTDEGSNYATFDLHSAGGTYAGIPHEIGIYNIQDWDGLYFVYAKVSGSDNSGILKANPSYDSDVTLKIGNNVVGSGTAHYNALFNSAGNVIGVQLWLDIDSWHPTGYTGTQTVTIHSDSTLFNGIKLSGSQGYRVSAERPIGFKGVYEHYLLKGTHLARSHYYWENVIEINDEFVSLTRNLDGNPYTSTLQITSDSGYFVDTSPNDINVPYIGSGTWNVTNPNGRIFEGTLVSGTPQPTPVQPVLRTGSVTMTDHNGTSISGFEVTAVNYYTGEEYTVSTETDVAVITLPMDRTVEIQNPQTGVYEEAPVGYYTFYGQKPGYKMLLEEGIKVSVLPEKYDPYKLCEILVTSESGPLTGKHQFQIRSRADFSILQTGTISAKSRTTGIWYNTTVTNGIATLILPYDTSDAISEYAGQYYVYATSPGYEDSDYGTQITVYPRTMYEVTTILLTPIGGVPPPGNVTLRIQVISETGQAVPNAEIFIAGVYGEGKDVCDTYTTSWTGFLEVSVPDNSIYDIVARAAGYYDSSQRIDLFIQDPTIIEMRLYLSGAPTVEPTTEPTGWVTGPPTTQPTSGIPDEDDGSGGLLMEAVRGISRAFGVGFATGKTIFGMLLALAIGFATAKQLRGGAAEFGMGLLGGTMLGILIGLIPVWTIVVLMLVVGLYIGYRYVGGSSNG
jgi:hypothetical protein